MNFLKRLATVTLTLTCLQTPALAQTPTVRFEDGKAFIKYIPIGKETLLTFPTYQLGSVEQAFRAYQLTYIQDPKRRFDVLTYLASIDAPKKDLGHLVFSTYRSFQSAISLDPLIQARPHAKIEVLEEFFERIDGVDTPAAFELLSVMFYDIPTTEDFMEIAEMSAWEIRARLLRKSPAAKEFTPNEMFPPTLPDLLSGRPEFLVARQSNPDLNPFEFYETEMVEKFILTLRAFDVLGARPTTGFGGDFEGISFGDAERIADFVVRHSNPAGTDPNPLQKVALSYFDLLRALVPAMADRVPSWIERIRNGKPADPFGEISSTLNSRTKGIDRTGETKVEEQVTRKNGRNYSNNFIRIVTRRIGRSFRR